MSSGRLFDAYIVVDWSARSRPSPAAPTRDALWVAEFVTDSSGDAQSETYWRTRQACRAFLRERMIQHTAQGRRVLAGYDFALGYPEGFAEAVSLAGSGPPWRRVWDALERSIVDDTENANNRFAVAAQLNRRAGGWMPGPFWGCPRGQVHVALEPTAPAYPYASATGLLLPRLRHTDRATPGVQPVWKLYGQGSVGSQTLLGIAALTRLRADPQLRERSIVWPLETGFSARPVRRRPLIVHAEVWPGLTPIALDPAIGVRDKAQVRVTAAWLAALDRNGLLGTLFARPTALTPREVEACVTEEGWILGAGTCVPEVGTIEAQGYTVVADRSSRFFAH